MRSTLRRSLACSIWFATLPALAALGCSGSGSSPYTGTEVPSTYARDVSPKVSSGDETSLVAGNTDFAFSLYHGLSAAPGGGTTGNLFYSPYSVSLALAMTYAGAHGETATQMATALDFTLASSALHPAFDKLDLSIEAAPKNATGADGAPFALNLADALWGDKSVKFQQSFVDTLALDYGASLRTVDFVDQSTQAEAAINAWVAGETNDKIDPLLGPGVITPATEFVIVNAVYFNAGWGTAFDPSQTQTGTFTRADGTTVKTPLMASGQTATAYAKGSNYQAIELPYSGGTTSMVIVLPDAGAYAAVESGLSGKLFDDVTSALSSNYLISLTMPSFTFHGASVSLVPEAPGARHDRRVRPRQGGLHRDGPHRRDLHQRRHPPGLRGRGRERHRSGGGHRRGRRGDGDAGRDSGLGRCQPRLLLLHPRRRDQHRAVRGARGRPDRQVSLSCGGSRRRDGVAQDSVPHADGCLRR